MNIRNDVLIERDWFYHKITMENRSGSRAAATFKMECFVIIVNGFQSLKRSILDVTAALDPPLENYHLAIVQYLFSIQKQSPGYILWKKCS